MVEIGCITTDTDHLPQLTQEIVDLALYS